MSDTATGGSVTLTRGQLARWLARQPATTSGTVDVTPDKRSSISSQLVRAVWDVRLTIGVGSDVPSSAAAAALADLVAWQLATPNAPSGLALLLSAGPPEVLDSARTLRAAVAGHLDIAILVVDQEDEAPTFDDGPAPNFS